MVVTWSDGGSGAGEKGKDGIYIWDGFCPTTAYSPVSEDSVMY